MKKTIYTGLGLSTLAVMFVACGGGGGASNSNTFGAPNVSEIVDESVPTTLKSASALLASNNEMGILSCPTDGSFSAACGATADAFIGFLRAGVFQEATAENVAGPQYYRYWVDVVNDALEETNQRQRRGPSLPQCDCNNCRLHFCNQWKQRNSFT